MKEIETYSISSSDNDNSRIYNKSVTGFKIKQKQDFSLPNEEELENEMMQDSDIKDIDNNKDNKDNKDKGSKIKNNPNYTYSNVVDVADVARINTPVFAPFENKEKIGVV